MTLDCALRLSEVLLALALVQQGIEHLRLGLHENRLAVARLLGAITLLSGISNCYALGGLMAVGLLSLRRFHGPYNGGSDLMTLVATLSLWLAEMAPTAQWRAAALGYLAIQLTLSYAQSGWVKIINPAWRSGQALVDVFAFTAYPVSEHTRRWARYPRLLRIMSWAIFGFELAFPFALIHWVSLLLALFVAAVFHLANACLFGLNRFFWIWLSAYPSIIWWQLTQMQQIFFCL